MQGIDLGPGVFKSIQQQRYPSLWCALINATNYLEVPGIFIWDLVVPFISLFPTISTKSTSGMIMKIDIVLELERVLEMM